MIRSYIPNDYDVLNVRRHRVAMVGEGIQNLKLAIRSDRYLHSHIDFEGQIRILQKSLTFGVPRIR